MTQEDKNLLLTDICARLPYGMKIQRNNVFNPQVKCVEELTVKNIEDYKISDNVETLEICPYLRPMSSMTKEELNEYKHLVVFSGSPNGAANFVDWLNKNMFDYRGLIEIGLAIAVTEENDPYKI